MMDSYEKKLLAVQEWIEWSKEEDRKKRQKEKGWYDKDLKARKRIIEAAPEAQLVDVWCSDCKKDAQAMGYKSVTTIHKPPRAVFRTSCPTCHKQIARHITDKGEDPWWRESEQLKKELLTFEV